MGIGSVGTRALVIVLLAGVLPLGCGDDTMKGRAAAPPSGLDGAVSPFDAPVAPDAFRPGRC